jgi:hypothetical protein
VDDTWYCYDPPQISCWAHVWHDADGGHWDTCMNCNYDRAEDNGSTCQDDVEGADLMLTCQDVLHTAGRMESRGDFNFLAFSLPIHNPAHFRRCLVGWGVHPMERSLATTYVTAGARILGGAANRKPLARDGFQTRLPASALQHVFIQTPPPTTTDVPRKKEERGAHVFWEEPSVKDKQHQELHIPYSYYPELKTFGQLIDHMYPGPEVFCQGTPRDPADSQFVVPLWLPYYDELYGEKEFVLLIEIICEQPDGQQVNAVTAALFDYVE